MLRRLHLVPSSPGSRGIPPPRSRCSISPPFSAPSRRDTRTTRPYLRHLRSWARRAPRSPRVSAATPRPRFCLTANYWLTQTLAPPPLPGSSNCGTAPAPRKRYDPLHSVTAWVTFAPRGCGYRPPPAASSAGSCSPKYGQPGKSLQVRVWPRGGACFSNPSPRRCQWQGPDCIKTKAEH